MRLVHPFEVVIDFTASWCGPCRIIAPVFADLTKKHPNVVFLKVDVDELKPIAEQFSVEAIPTFLFMKEGDVKDRVVGSPVESVYLLSMLDEFVMCKIYVSRRHKEDVDEEEKEASTSGAAFDDECSLSQPGPVGTSQETARSKQQAGKRPAEEHADVPPRPTQQRMLTLGGALASTSYSFGCVLGVRWYACAWAEVGHVVF
ncbi:hypothetical protein ABZP36_004387 [Zizania latifolia]